MTKEPIMIDDVDVAECKFFDEWKHCELCEKFAEKENRHLLIEADLRCKEQGDCYYKQLKRKEQECESLKDTIKLQNEMQKEVCEEKNKELDQLKTENKKLKELLNTRIEDLCDSCGASSMMPMPCKVYEQALQEIKEIITNSFDSCYVCNSKDSCEKCLQGEILQKCEVLNGNQ